MRIGLIGSGYWAKTVHGAALAASDGVDFVGVWGRNSEKTQHIAAKFGVDAYSDIDALIRDVDALEFAVPPSVQKDIAVRAAVAGKHLLLEKPIALNLVDAEELVRAADRAGVSTVVFHTALFQSDISEWIEVAQNTTWVSGTCEWVADALSAPTSPFRDSPWRHEKGALWDIGPHVLSVFISLLGPVTEVTAVPGITDTVHLILKHTDGRTSSSVLSLNGPVGNDVVNLRVWNTNASAQMPDSRIDPTEALGKALNALVSRAAGNEIARRSDVAYGRDIVAILDSAEQQLRAHAAV